MASDWTVDADVKRVDLTHNDKPFWIELKTELSVGDTKKMQASGFRSLSQQPDKDVELNVDYALLVFVKIKVWLADWSLTDSKGKRLPCDLDTIRALKGPVFDLIEKAVDAHALAVAEEEKKAGGENEPLKTSA